MCVYTRRANPRTEPSGILGRGEVIGYGVGVLGDSGAGVVWLSLVAVTHGI